MTSIETLLDGAKDHIRAFIHECFEPFHHLLNKLESLMTPNEHMKAAIALVVDTNKKLAEQVKTLDTENETLSKQNDDLTAQLADLKGKEAGGNIMTEDDLTAGIAAIESVTGPVPDPSLATTTVQPAAVLDHASPVAG